MPNYEDLAFKPAMTWGDLKEFAKQNKLFAQEDYYKTIMEKRAIYLGHSKANIDDLFKTENEE